MSLLYLVLGFLGTSGIQEAGEWPVTRAEATDYRETSSHADVMAFLEALGRAGGDFVLESLGTSTGGRDIPLVVISRHPRLTPSQAQRSGKPIVYLQANIHGGEVEGKEVALMLLRELARGGADHLLDAMTLLVCPVYNCDGNDAFGPGDRQRPNDNGPDPVGLRPNGMGLDLNRDCVKAESPEMRGVLDNVYRRWDPDVILDLHTTNGTRHGYALTYSPPLGPDTVDIDDPTITARVKLDVDLRILSRCLGQDLYTQLAWSEVSWGTSWTLNNVDTWDQDIQAVLANTKLIEDLFTATPLSDVGNWTLIDTCCEVPAGPCDSLNNRITRFWVVRSEKIGPCP